MKRFQFFCIVLIIFILTKTNAQQSLIYIIPNKNYIAGQELFEKQKYAAAQLFFQKVMNDPNTINTELRTNAGFYAGLCALELFNPDAENLLNRFIASNPYNYKVNDAYFYLGRFQYNNKKFDKAIDYFSKVNLEQLNADKQYEYRFETAYSYFMKSNYDTARLHFYEIKDKDNQFSSPAIYYYAHIAYIQKNYETALEGFTKLRNDETFASIVPYYITQVYFLQKKYEKVTEYAPPLLDSVIEKRMGEMARIIGESYFKQGKTNESLPYFEKFATKVPSMTAEDRYLVGYAYYKAGEFAKAIAYFEAIASGATALSQNASYHLADCYLRTNDKKKARLAFAAASSLDFNAEIKENALFNYAVATYEQSMSAFNEAVKAFDEFIRLYPYSIKTDDAYQYLVLAYSSTKNYQAALESIQKIKKKDNTIRKALQKVAFYRGLELYNALNFEQSIVLFDRSLECSEFDASITARNYYWKAEANYRLNNYEAAIVDYNKFLTSSGSSNLPEFERTQYNVGYCYFNLKKYDEALDWFRRYLNMMKDAKNKQVADSYNRIGDCQFMKLSYWVAIENYEKALLMNVTDADYSLFQKGFALGLVNRHEKKIAILEQLLLECPKSAYTDDALYEKGRAYVIMNNTPLAIVSFQKLLTDFPVSSYIPKALLQLGLIYFNTDKNTEALVVYKKAIEQFPGTADSRNALSGLKAVYVDMNDVDAYFSYVEKSGEKINLRTTEQDSLTYTSAENVYMSGDCDKSTQQFAKYIERFKDGAFLTHANFYFADCNFRQNKKDEALVGFEYVLAKPRNMFTEQSLVNAVSIRYERKEYEPALELYKRMENEVELEMNIQNSKIGQMRCYFRLNDFQNAIVASKKLLTTAKLPTEVIREAHYILAKSYLETADNTNALVELKQVSKDMKSAEGAECKYLLANFYYTQNKKDLAEKEIFNFIEKNTPYQYWLGKSFLLLSTIYIDKKDVFQATQTLQSIIDYYEIKDDGIKAEATERKAKLTAIAVANDSIKQQDVEVNMNEKIIK